MVYVKVIEGTLYKGDKDWSDITISDEAWDALDRTLQYSVENKKLIAQGQETFSESEQSPLAAKQPLPLALMLDRAGCGESHKIAAVWEVVINQDHTKANEITKKEEEVRLEHERLTKEYEAAR